VGDGGDDGDVAPGGGFAVVVETFFGGKIDDHIDGVLFEQLVGGKLVAGVDEAGLVGCGQSEELSDGAVLKSGAAADDPFQGRCRGVEGRRWRRTCPPCRTQRCLLS